MGKTLIRNAFILDPAYGRMGNFDILIEQDNVQSIEDPLSIAFDEKTDVIDAHGALTVPGFVDLQVNPGFTIQHISQELLYSGVTTPLIMPCNINGKTYLQYYGGLEAVVKACDGLHTNVAAAISIQPEDTGLHETYIELSVPAGGITKRVEEFERLGISAIGEVVLPLEGTAHISSNLSEPFLDELLNVATGHNYPVLLHTGLGTEGVLKAIEIANGRRLHICHVGSTVAGGDLHLVLKTISNSPNITCDTHLAPMAGTNSRNSKLLKEYFTLGNAYSIDPETLAATALVDLESSNPPFYYSKDNLLENNIICALSGAVDAIESDDLGEGVRSRMMLENLLTLFRTARTEHSQKRLMQGLLAKLTCRPAEILQLDRRGSIAQGYYADIVIFDAILTRVDTVLVNGRVALRNGTITGVKAGRYLARSARKTNIE